MDFVKKYWDRIAVIIAAFAALAVSVSNSDLAKSACFATAKCKTAYELGLTPEQVSATTVTQPIIMPVSPTDVQ